jgi:glycosyltransferase involved in cell wall biosynthesis
MEIWLLKIGEILPLGGPSRKLRTAVLADTLVERGHRVLWWTSSFDHFQKKWIFERDEDFYIREHYRIRALKGCGYARNISPARLLDHRLIAHKFKRQAPTLPKPDAIVTAMPAYDLAYQAVTFAKKHSVPVIVDIRDQWPDIFVEHVPRSAQAFARLLLFREYSMLRSLLKRADGIVSMATPLLQWGLEYAHRGKTWKDDVFYLGYPKGRPGHTESEKIKAVRTAAGNRFVVIFIGTFATYHNPAGLLDAAHSMAGEDVLFVLAGDGELREELKRRASGLSNVHFPGWLDQDDITALLNMAQVGVCPSGHSGSSVFLPNKAFAYFSEGLPILSSFSGEIRDIVDRFEVGFNYNDTETLVAAVRRLRQDEALYARMSRNAEKLFCDRFDATVIYNRYADHIEAVSGAKERRNAIAKSGHPPHSAIQS